MAKKHYTDQERYEYCRKFKVSGQTQAQFCKDNNLARETFRGVRQKSPPYRIRYKTNIIPLRD